MLRDFSWLCPQGLLLLSFGDHVVLNFGLQTPACSYYLHPQLIIFHLLRVLSSRLAWLSSFLWIFRLPFAKTVNSLSISTTGCPFFFTYFPFSISRCLDQMKPKHLLYHSGVLQKEFVSQPLDCFKQPLLSGMQNWDLNSQDLSLN